MSEALRLWFVKRFCEITHHSRVLRHHHVEINVSQRSVKNMDCSCRTFVNRCNLLPNTTSLILMCWASIRMHSFRYTKTKDPVSQTCPSLMVVLSGWSHGSQYSHLLRTGSRTSPEEDCPWMTRDAFCPTLSETTECRSLLLLSSRFGLLQIPTWFASASEEEMTTYIASQRTSCNCIERLNLPRLSTILTRDGRLWWPINASWRRIDPDYYPKSDSISKHDDKLQSCHVKRPIISFSIKTDLIKIYSISLIRPKIDWSPHDWQSTKIKLFFQYSISLQESRRQKKWQVLWTHRQEDQRIKSYRNC